MISHDSLRFDQPPQSPCSRTQRRPMLVLLPHLANSAQRCLPPAPLFITPRYRYPSVFPNLPAKTPAIPAHPHPNPIDRPASTPPAAHFKRLYRNCPKKGTSTDTSSRGSHDRVLTFFGNNRRPSVRVSRLVPTGEKRVSRLLIVRCWRSDSVSSSHCVLISNFRIGDISGSATTQPELLFNGMLGNALDIPGGTVHSDLGDFPAPSSPTRLPHPQLACSQGASHSP